MMQRQMKDTHKPNYGVLSRLHALRLIPAVFCWPHPDVELVIQTETLGFWCQNQKAPQPISVGAERQTSYF